VSDESLLIERAQQGDQAALAEIVELHQGIIYNVALRMCGNAYDAEETLQETFLNAIRALPRFEGRSRFSTWLYRIASNACLMRRRHEATQPNIISVDSTTDDGNGDFTPKYFIDWSAKPEKELLDAELKQVMEKAVTHLPPNLRIVFIWRELEGLSTQETAEVLEISENTVKVRLHRARLRLRELLSNYFAERLSAEASYD